MVAVHGISNHDVGDSSQTKRLHPVAKGGTNPSKAAPSADAEGQNTHGTDYGWQDGSGQPKLRLPDATVRLCHAGGDKVDEPATQEEGDDGADETREGKQTETPDLPPEWRLHEDPAGGHLGYDVPGKIGGVLISRARNEM